MFMRYPGGVLAPGNTPGYSFLEEHEHPGVSEVTQEKADPAISYRDRKMNLQHREQKMEDEPRSCDLWVT